MRTKFMPAAWQVTEARVCEQLAQGWYLNAERPAVEPATVSQVQRPNHHTNSFGVKAEIHEPTMSGRVGRRY